MFRRLFWPAAVLLMLPVSCAATSRQRAVSDAVFVQAIHRHDAVRLNELLKTKRPDNVNTLLDVAIDDSDVAAVALLLTYGANPNFGINGPIETPLIHAARLGRWEIASVLLDRGADPNGRGGLGGRVWFPLYCAVANGHHQVAGLLLTSKADPDARLGMDSSGGVVRYLKPGEGETCLMVAAKQGDSEMVELLLKYGANPTLADGKGKRAIDYLKEYESPVARISGLLEGRIKQK